MGIIRNIIESKPCHICAGELSKGNVISIKVDHRKVCNIWYSICDDCLDNYPEIADRLKVILDLDHIDDFNHIVMLNLIDSIKAHRFGCRFIPAFRKDC